MSIRWRGAVAGFLLAMGAWAGCPGEYPGLQDWYIPRRDRLRWARYDVGSRPRDQASRVDSGPLKVDRPSSKVDRPPILPPDRSSTGCNCSPTQLCLNSKCYNFCQASGPCGVDSACAANQICIVVTPQNVFVCMDASAQPDGACNQTAWCPNHYVCANPGFCRAQCPTVGLQCPTGGICQAAGGSATCKFCVK